MMSPASWVICRPGDPRQADRAAGQHRENCGAIFDDNLVILLSFTNSSLVGVKCPTATYQLQVITRLSALKTHPLFNCLQSLLLVQSTFTSLATSHGLLWDDPQWQPRLEVNSQSWHWLSGLTRLKGTPCFFSK